MKLAGYGIRGSLIASFFLFMPVVLAQPAYVRVNGLYFSLDGKPYYFIGTNFWYGCYLGSTGRTGERGRLVRELDRLQAIGIDNLRILGGSESSSAQDAVKPAIQLSPGVYDDSLLIGLDFLLSEMNKRNMRAVIFLNNYWSWSGGMGQYLTWFGGGGNGYDTSPFYRNASANVAFRQYITDLIRRQNTVTGSYYYEDPAIMAWELANEPRPGYNSAYYDYFYRWIDSAAQLIHSLDSNHLVTTGSEGLIGCNGSESVFLSAHQSRSIDYATIHLWALNWGWFNPSNAQGTFPSTLAQAKEYIQKHIASARTLNKPLTMEEFGLPRDGQLYAAGTATTFRDSYFTEILKTVYDSAAAGSPIAGSNFWGWGGEGRSPNGDHMWRVGNPFVCDPPMEAQGLNSVYDTDSSTIGILQRHSELMLGLRKTSGVARENIPFGVELYQNYPNPFNPATTMSYAMNVAGRVSLKIYDVLGREIATLANGYQNAGYHSVSLNADDRKLASGLYIYRLSVGNFFQTKKMILLK